MEPDSISYNPSEIETVRSLAAHYMHYGENRKARELLELAYQMSGEDDIDTRALLVDASYREGNNEKFALYIKDFSKKDLTTPRRKVLLALFLYFKNNRRAFDLFKSANKMANS